MAGASRGGRCGPTELLVSGNVGRRQRSADIAENFAQEFHADRSWIIGQAAGGDATSVGGKHGVRVNSRQPQVAVLALDRGGVDRFACQAGVGPRAWQGHVLALPKHLMQVFKCRILLPGSGGPRLTRLSARAWFRRLELLTQPEPLPEHGCHWQLYLWSDDGGTYRAKAGLFRRSSILFRPRSPAMPGVWWSRRVPPPGPSRLLQVRLSP